ncbi:TPA: AAA family ATPase [Klebsiella pneumoniae]
MDFENELTSKILDPIHGTIRLTTLEIAFINHPLFQRLRNIKQNSFLYKVFPSAVHSRFEHSLGVLHLSSEILNNLRLNAIRYQKKYDDGHVFGHIDQIPKHNIQELRLAALMHDIGHGPVSHQFESFMPGKHEFSDVLPTAYHSIIDVLSKPEQKVEHEQLSLLFSLMIYHDLRKQGKVDDEINIENVLKIIEKRYGDQQIIEEINGKATDILPLMTSIISSCPIDADRMDYLLRDGYFSGVKCGIYDYNRLFMSIVPVEEQGKLYLAYKESGIDSIAEFIGARSSLFSQVYYHKTNRAFATMLDRGVMRDGEGREIDFRNTVILMTANLGSDLLMQLLDEQPEASESDLHELLRPVLRGHFQPALLARFQTVIYRPLPAAALRAIVGMKLGQVSQRLACHYGITTTLSESLFDALTEACLLPDTGARNVDSLLNQQILPALSQQLLSHMAAGQKPRQVTLGYHEEEGVVMAFDEGTISDE